MSRGRRIPLVPLMLAQPVCATVYQYLAKSLGTEDGQGAVTGAIADAILRLVTLPGFWILVAVEAVSLVIWLAILERVDLARAFPLTAISYCLVFATSVFVFHETVGLTTFVGSGLILAGAGLLAFEERAA